MAYRIQFRRDTSANWILNDPTLLQGEMGYELDTGYAKIGDGVTAWTSLTYFGGTGPTGEGVPSGGTSGQFLMKNSSNDYDTVWTSSLVSSTPPGSSGATGATGQIAQDSNYLYVCIATNTWRRTQLTSW